jgi:hypothetical protein
MTKITKEVLFTELSIKLAIMDAKLDKLLELAMKPNTVNIVGDDAEHPSVTGNLESTTDYDLTKPYGFTHENIK